ncbi:MAG: terminase family protein, partial [Kiritimatiellales bacterium]
MSRPEYEVLYGGAAGGGKTQALLAEALRQVHIPHYRAIIFRKKFRELEHMIDTSRKIYQAAFPRAVFNASSYFWKFPSGAKIYFANMQSSSFKEIYQGQAYDFVAFDELTHFTWDEYSYMFSRCRSSGPGLRNYVRATSNPGGVGHGWVKDRFITIAPPMTTIVRKDDLTYPDGTIHHVERSSIFVPSRVFDNPILMANSPEYIANMAMMPEAQRNALLYGSWDSFSGQAFIEWRDEPDHYADRKWTHVIDPFDPPEHWRIYRGFDWGLAKPYSVGWYAVDTERRIYRILELYGCTREPNTGVNEHPGEIAAHIREMETTHPWLKGKRINGIADPAIFAADASGESIAAMMERSPNFIRFDRGDHTRIAGKMQFHYRMSFDSMGKPMFQVFKGCKHFIRTFPTLVYDEKHLEDINTEQEDHAYDECLAGRTKVITADGQKNIKSLVGTEGYVYSSDGALHRYHDCRMTREFAPVFTIILEDGTKFRATANHPVMLA